MSQVTLRIILGEVVGGKSDWSGFSRVGSETLETAMSGDFAQKGGMNGVVEEKKCFSLRWEKQHICAPGNELVEKDKVLQS